MCIQEDPRKKLMNSSENAQKNMMYQFFFINYLISISQADIITKSYQLEISQKSEQHRPISQKIFIILAKVLEALGDSELNAKLDKVITDRIQTFKKASMLSS
jgi:hypothetical protein